MYFDLTITPLEMYPKGKKKSQRYIEMHGGQLLQR